MSIEVPQGPSFLPPGSNRYDVLKKDPRYSETGGLTISGEDSARVYLHFLFNWALFSPGLSRETSSKLAGLIPEVYIRKRDFYRPGSHNGISLNDFEVVEDIIGKFMEKLEGNLNHDHCTDIPFYQLMGKAIELSVVTVHEAARELPLRERKEYADIIEPALDIDKNELLQNENGPDKMNYTFVRCWGKRFIADLRKP